MVWGVKAGPETGRTGAVTNTTAVMGMPNSQDVKPKRTVIIGRVTMSRLTVTRLMIDVRKSCADVTVKQPDASERPRSTQNTLCGRISSADAFILPATFTNEAIQQLVNKPFRACLVCFMLTLIFCLCIVQTISIFLHISVFCTGKVDLQK